MFRVYKINGQKFTISLNLGWEIVGKRWSYCWFILIKKKKKKTERVMRKPSLMKSLILHFKMF